MPPHLSSHLLSAPLTLCVPSPTSPRHLVTSSRRSGLRGCVAASLRQIDHRNKHDDGSKLGKLRDMSGKVKA